MRSALRSGLGIGFVLTAGLAADVGAAAAQGGLTLEAGASSVAPPSGLSGDAGRFLVGGLRLETGGLAGSGARAFLLAGRSLDDDAGGNFVSGGLGGTVAAALTSHFGLELEARAFGFDVDAPFAYRAYGLEGGPSLVFRAPSIAVRMTGEAGVARSRVEAHRDVDSRVRVLEDDLWRYGASAELLVGSRAVMVGAGGGLHESAGGRYETVGGRLLMAGGLGVAELRVDSWSTPLGRETIAGIGFSLSAADVWSLRGYFGRSEPDPLTLAEPGGGGGGVLVGRRLVTLGPGAAAAPLHEIVARSGDKARVRITVRPPSDPNEVVVLGDFTLWEPVAMQRSGDTWEVVLDVAPGVHHFGFLVDGSWYVPADAPDVVPDEWGRENATIVVDSGTGSGSTLKEPY